MAWPVLPHGFLGSSSGDNDAYQIERSLRFNSADSAYLNRTPASAGNRKTWTWSGWVKLTLPSGATTRFFGARVDDSNRIIFNSPSTFNLQVTEVISGVSTILLNTNSVFRDPSAWYHLVLAFDSTQATASNRLKLYVNGSEQTSFSTDNRSSITQNYDGYVNNNIAHYLGTATTGVGNFSDYYLSECHFIDGQALTPSSFGETDAITGRWKAKAFSGSYGLNGFYLPFSNNSSTTTRNLLTYSEDFTNAAWLNYQSTESSNVATAPNGSSTADKLIPDAGVSAGQLYRTFAATDNTTYTFSVYAKADGFSALRLYIQKKATSPTYAYADYNLSSASVTATSGSPSSTSITAVGNSWYRVSISADVGTGGTASPSINIQHIGVAGNGSSGLLLWGAQLEDNGVLGPYWPTVASASSSTLRIGQDLSISAGGYNSWFANNFSVTAGAGNDSLVDSPTNYGTDTGVGGEVRGNYCTLNPIAAITSNTSTNGNLDTSVANASSVRGTFPLVSGKWYWEVVPTSTANNAQIGICSATNIDTIPQVTSTGWCYNQSTGNKFNDPTGSAYGASYAQNDVIGIALDMDTGKIWWSKNGVWQASGNPATGANAAFTNVTGTVVPVIATTGAGVSGTFTSNFGQRPFAYTAPSGFKALCTTNLPTPTIQKPSSYMDVVTYTGNGSTQTISSLGFSPDLVWIKSRSQTASHGIHDTLRVIGGNEAVLSSDSTAAESTGAAYISSFDSNGFTLNANTSGNNNTSTYVAWAWDEAPIAGMDIVGYTGDNNSSTTIPHSLGVTPSMIIVKPRSGSYGTEGWQVWHKSLSASNVLQLNTTAAQAGTGTFTSGIISSSPTSSAFGFVAGSGGVLNVNASSTTYIAYLFAEVEGFSKFGSYTGTGTTDGAFVWCGFRPRWVMVKSAGDAGGWTIMDSSRLGYNAANSTLYAEATTIEQGYLPIDILSNGFKIRLLSTGTSFNTNGIGYIFAAFAESPFKYARAR